MGSERNSACLCGSGKKYKSCCLALELKRARWDGLEESLRGKIMDFYNSARFDVAYQDAINAYGDADMSDISTRRLFYDWYVHDYVSPAAKSIIVTFLGEEGAKLSKLEQETATGWASSVLRFYEVGKIKRGIGYMVRDIFDGSEHFAFDRSSSATVSKHDIMYARLYRVGKITRFAGGLVNLPHTFLSQIKEYVISNSAHCHTMNDYLKSQSLSIIKYLRLISSRKPEVLTAEDDLVSFSVAEYHITNTRKVCAALDNADDFVYCGHEAGDDRIHRYDWVTSPDVEFDKGDHGNPNERLKFLTYLMLPDSGEEFLVLANLSVGRKRLVVECLSDARLEAAKKRVDQLLGGLAVHDADRYGDEAEMYADPGSDDDTDYVDPLIERKGLESYFERWLVTKTSWLGNLSPLEASQTAQGKIEVEQSLKSLENVAERNILAGNNETTYNIMKDIIMKLRRRLSIESTVPENLLGGEGNHSRL